MTKKCDCENISFGSYVRTIPVWYDARKRVVGIDICIVIEILNLWKLGIITIESCCGHNKSKGYIAVDEIFITKMLELGYKQDKEHELDNIFYPKYNIDKRE